MSNHVEKMKKLKDRLNDLDERLANGKTIVIGKRIYFDSGDYTYPPQPQEAPLLVEAKSPVKKNEAAIIA